MSTTMARCFLHCLKDPEKNIELRHQVKTLIGRNPHTKIEDKRCSKNQVEVIADFSTLTVQIRQLGFNPSSINNKPLNGNSTGILKDGDILSLLIGRYAYKLEFSKVSKSRIENDEENMNKKFKISDEIDSDMDESNEEKRVERIKMQLSSLKKQHSNNNFSPKKNIPQTISPSIREIIVKTKPLTSSIWEETDSLLIYSSLNLEAKSKIAAFDLDGTLICTKSGKVFPIDKNDWRILYPEVKTKLKHLVQDGYKIVLFTNQKGIAIGKTNIADFKSKIEKVIAALSIPAQVFVCFKNDIFRKPAPGMWNYLIEKCNDNIEINLNKSFYVGDAAGRPVKWALGKKKDFALTDRLFALNLNLVFHTPEEFFLNWKPAPFIMPEFDPRKIFENKFLHEPSDANIILPEQEIVILVGYPASGKSFFSKNYMIPKGYYYVNRDTLSSWQKCISACKEAITKGKSVIIDNTNPDRESRERYIQCAKEAKISCRCFWFTATLEQALHNNQFRILSDPEHANKAVNPIVLNSYKSKFVAPSLAEGFAEIIKINFIPKFKNANLEKLYKMFLG